MAISCLTAIRIVALHNCLENFERFERKNLHIGFMDMLFHADNPVKGDIIGGKVKLAHWSPKIFSPLA